MSRASSRALATRTTEKSRYACMCASTEPMRVCACVRVCSRVQTTACARSRVWGVLDGVFGGVCPTQIDARRACVCDTYYFLHVYQWYTYTLCACEWAHLYVTLVLITCEHAQSILAHTHHTYTLTLKQLVCSHDMETYEHMMR